MADLRSAGDGEALPWLEAVEDEDEPRGVSARKMLAALALVLAGAAVVAATMFWVGRQQGGSGPPQLIRAEAGPYKVRPDDPGGLDVAGESGTAFATGAGEDSDSQLDLSQLKDPPPPPPSEEGEPKRLPPNETREPVPPAPPEPAPGAGAAAVIQLGAYGSTAKADTAWRMLSSQFPEVAALTKIVVPYSGGYRLRAGASSSAEARAACAAVTAGGENCFVVR